jgi:hypothetical protein
MSFMWTASEADGRGPARTSECSRTRHLRRRRIGASMTAKRPTPRLRRFASTAGNRCRVENRSCASVDYGSSVLIYVPCRPRSAARRSGSLEAEFDPLTSGMAGSQAGRPNNRRIATPWVTHEFRAVVQLLAAVSYRP